MLARLLVPIIPLLAVAVEVGTKTLAAGRSTVTGIVAVAAAAGLVLTPAPVTGRRLSHGVADEWDHYADAASDWAALSARGGAILRRYFRGLPVRLAFVGEQARLVYYSEVTTAIECETGLTDARVAHQPLPSPRGRVGHEKHASLDYLLRERRAQVAFNPKFRQILGLDGRLPEVPIVLDGYRGQLLTWDPQLVAALRARGARIPDVPAQLDAYLATIDRVPRAQVAADYAALRAFYFDVVGDPAREARFRARLGDRPPATVPRPAAPPGAAAPASPPG